MFCVVSTNLLITLARWRHPGLPVKPCMCFIGQRAPRCTAAMPWQSKLPEICLHFCRCWFCSRPQQYRSNRGVRPTDLSLILRKLFCTYDEYFYFYFIPTWRVILTTISGFLFTTQFWHYAILCVKPSAYGIPFFCTSSWWMYVLWADLWFVVVCRCIK